MDTTLYSRRNKLCKSNFLKFRARVESGDGKDVARSFTGCYYPRWRSFYLCEVRKVNAEYRLIELYPFFAYLKRDDDYFYTSDFRPGCEIALREPGSGRENGTYRKFVVTECDAEQLLTQTHSFGTSYAKKHLPEDVVEKLKIVRDAFIHHAGDNVELGIKDVGHRFRNCDKNGDRKFNIHEFTAALEDVRVDFSSNEIKTLFAAFDKNNDRAVSYEEFMDVIRGPMPEFRKQLIRRAWRKVDINNDGKVTLQDIQVRFNAAGHPDVTSGALTESQVLQGFLSIWDTKEKNGAVTYAEFCDYYYGVSACIEDDELFEAVISTCWKL